MTKSHVDLRKAGLKVTLQRLKILELLENSPAQHLSAEDVYKALSDQGEDIGLATVYRVLTLFETAGIVQRHHFESGSSVFEIGQGDHHDHIVCQDCAKVFEFNDPTIEARQEAVAEQMGFRLSGHALHLYAHCNKINCEHRSKDD